MHTRVVQVQGCAVTVTDHGQGSPVLLVHGNPDTRHVWDAVIQRVAPTMRCLAPDLPGFGGSTQEAFSFNASLEGMACWLDEVVQACGVGGPIDLVVHDIGGLFGLAWAVKHPHKIRRLIVTNSLFQADYRWHFWARIWRTPVLGEISIALLRAPLLGPLVFAASVKLAAPCLAWREVFAGYAAVTPRMLRMVLHIYRASDPVHRLGWEQAQVELAQRIPSAVLWGARDPYIPIQFSQRFGVQWVKVLPSVGHWVALENPDALAALMHDVFI